MHAKTLKRLLSAALALVLCLTATGCGGDVSPTQTPESTPEPAANTLVLGVCRQSASALSFRGVVEDYNDTSWCTSIIRIRCLTQSTRALRWTCICWTSPSA